MAPFLSNSQQWDGTYANPDDQETRIIQQMKPQEEQKIRNIQEDASQVEIEVGAKAKVVRMKSENSNERFLIRLLSAGENEAKVIKVIRDLTKLSLKEAREIVNKLGVVTENLSKKEAENISKKLEAAGAKVRIEEMPSADIPTSLIMNKKEKKQVVTKPGVHHNIKPVKKDPNIVTLSTHRSNTEYKRLLTQLNNQLDVKSGDDSRNKIATLLKDKDQRNITNLAKKTGWDARSIRMMAMAQERSAKTNLPAQLYYAIYRTALPTGETALFITDADAVKKIWKKAIKQHIIDASFEDQLDVYLQKIIQEKQIPLPPRDIG